MIGTFIHFSETVLYAVNADNALLIPAAYFTALLVCILLREFVQGWLKWVLALLFLASFGTFWYIFLLDYSPWSYILPAIVLFGCISGLWNWIRDIAKDVKEL